MNKLAAFLTVLMIGGFVTAKCSDASLEAVLRSLGEPRGEREINDRYATYHLFKQTFEETRDRVGRGEISLRDGCSLVHNAAILLYPQFLPLLVDSEPGTTDEERVAANLVGHVRAIAMDDSDYRVDLNCLDTELRDYCEQVSRKAPRAGAPGSPF